MNMLKIFGKEYYIDISLIGTMCQVPVQNSVDKINEMNLNIPVYNLVNMCCQTLLTEYEEIDTTLGYISETQTSISFRLAFNTLLQNNILKTLEEDYE
jgi:hypothetical protein